VVCCEAIFGAFPSCKKFLPFLEWCKFSIFSYPFSLLIFSLAEALFYGLVSSGHVCVYAVTEHLGVIQTTDARRNVSQEKGVWTSGSCVLLF
jgi:hypothetical protein